MNAFNHYASLMVICLSIGYFIPKIFEGPVSLLLCLVLGSMIGVVWPSITGYKINKGDDNER